MSKPQKPSLREAAEMAVDVLTNLGYDPVDLREALAEQATEPAGRCKWCLAYNGHLDFCPALAEQAEQEPVATVVDESEEQTNTMSWILSLPLPVGTKLYAAPVRTKDLTDDEIWDALTSIGFGTSCYEDARAVIAADRRKNR